MRISAAPFFTGANC